MKADPHGEVATWAEEVLEVTDTVLPKAWLENSLRNARMSDKERYAQTFRMWVWRTGLTQSELAEHIGTSQSRLSTYMSGRVTPSGIISEKVRALAYPENGQRLGNRLS